MNNKIILSTLTIVVIVVGITIFLNLKNYKQEDKTTITSAILAEISRQDVFTQSDGIILGKVKDMRVGRSPSVLRPGEEDIVTDVDILVEKYLFNPQNLSKKEITVETVGGTIGKETMIMEEAPVFEKDQDVIVFLKKKDENIFMVYGWLQGKFTVEKGNVGVGEAEKSILKNIFGREEMSLSDFEKEIYSIVSSSTIE